MKKLLITAAILLCASMAFAQDYIVSKPMFRDIEGPTQFTIPRAGGTFYFYYETPNASFFEGEGTVMAIVNQELVEDEQGFLEMTDCRYICPAYSTHGDRIYAEFYLKPNRGGARTILITPYGRTGVYITQP